jgi:hypothetical protein
VVGLRRNLGVSDAPERVRDLHEHPYQSQLRDIEWTFVVLICFTRERVAMPRAKGSDELPSDFKTKWY